MTGKCEHRLVGYVLSKTALDRFVEDGLRNDSIDNCRKDDAGAEDAEMGKCMLNLKVEQSDHITISKEFCMSGVCWRFQGLFRKI